MVQDKRTEPGGGDLRLYNSNIPYTCKCKLKQINTSLFLRVGQPPKASSPPLKIGGRPAERRSAFSISNSFLTSSPSHSPNFTEWPSGGDKVPNRMGGLFFKARFLFTRPNLTSCMILTTTQPILLTTIHHQGGGDRLQE